MLTPAASIWWTSCCLLVSDGLRPGAEPKYIAFDGGNLVSFVLSANLHRRHMSPGQQAAIVASAQDWAKAQTVGKPKSVNVDQLATVDQRAAQSGASIRTQERADAVAKANPDLAKKVAHGEVSLPAAVKEIERAKPGPSSSRSARHQIRAGPLAWQGPIAPRISSDRARILVVRRSGQHGRASLERAGAAGHSARN